MDGLKHSGVFGFLDLFFPRRCERCAVRLTDPSLDVACPDCAPQAEWIQGSSCPRCGAQMAGAIACAECAGRDFGFEAAVAAGRYAGFIRELVHRFKFDGRMDLAKPLAARIAGRVRSAPWRSMIQAIVPVPMRRMKVLFERRYNPAELLAERLAKELGCGICAGLKQVRGRPSQTGLTGAERLKNPAGAYAAKNGKKLKNRTILLVDDVLTTGATAGECARVLKAAGSGPVYLAVIGR